MKFTRGDTYAFKFRRIDTNNNPIQDKPIFLWFTVKANHNTDEIVIQKTLEDMTFDDNFYYHCVIYPEDTINLNYGDYVYDIQVQIDKYVKTIAKGELSLTKEVTFTYNKVMKNG